MGADSGYTLLGELGSGAIATVVRVVAADGRTLAGKILHTSRAQDPEAVERFRREAEFVAGLDHPNVAQVFGMEVIDGRDVLLMELVEGTPLDEVVAREAPLPVDRLVAIARGLAAGLAAAHGRGVVHRDLKPANVLLAADDVPKIVDFGMARASSMQGVDPSAFAVLGTPDYMAPETLDPLAVDARADLYSLGCILFELAVGRPPFDGPTSFAVLEAHRVAPVPALPDTIPLRLQRLIEALLAKAPSDRVQSAAAVGDWLDTLDDGAALTLHGNGGSAASAAGAAPRALCVSCRTPLVDGLSVCLGCGMSAPVIEVGDHTLFVNGPGEIAEKFDSKLRQILVDWVRANASLNLDARLLSAKIPRLPFCLLTGVSASSGRAVASSLEQLGIQTVLVLGGRTSLPAIRKKVFTVGGRLMAIFAVSSAWLLSQGLGSTMFTAWLVSFAIAPVAIGAQGFRAFLRQRGRPLPALPPALQRRVDAVGSAGPTLRAARHRDALRGVVTSALALHRSDGGHDAAVTEELGNAMDIALAAAGRLDALDADLEQRDLREADGPTRAVLGERDKWSSRLLELHATLEMLRARLASARAAAGKLADTDALDELRARVEALEEVQRV